MPRRVLKAVAYITRGDELLVFVHRDVDLMRTGVQVPAGSVDEGETPAEAVMREALEETGIEGLTLVSFLGTQDYDRRPDRDQVHERHVFHLAAPDGLPDQWVWFEEHDGGREREAFLYSWIPVTQGHVLSAGQGALLGLLR